MTAAITVNISTILPKVLAVSGSVYAILQAIKKYYPQINGKYSLLVNGGLSVLAIVTVTPQNELLTLNTLTAIIVAVIGSAGIHGTMKDAFNVNVQRNQPQPK